MLWHLILNLKYPWEIKSPPPKLIRICLGPACVWTKCLSVLELAKHSTSASYWYLIISYLSSANYEQILLGY